MSIELEALQQLSKLVFIYGGVEQYRLIETALKALEIIKKKRVDTTTLFVCIEKYDLETFNSYATSTIGELPLTQEEFDLLKEVLL